MVGDEAVGVAAGAVSDVAADAKVVVETTEDGDKQPPSTVLMSVTHPTCSATKTLIEWDVRVETISSTNVNATERDAAGAAAAVAADMEHEGATMTEDAAAAVITMIATSSRPTPNEEMATTTRTKIAAR